MLPNNIPIVTGGLTGTASFTSSSVWISKVVRLSSQIVISSGSAVGSFRFDGSDDQAPSGQQQAAFTPTNWNPIGSATVVVASTTAGARVFLIPSFETSYEYVRLVFVDGSAASAVGTFNVRIKSQGL